MGKSKEPRFKITITTTGTMKDILSNLFFTIRSLTWNKNAEKSFSLKNEVSIDIEKLG